MYSLGIDFGTLSVRAVLVDTHNGHVLGEVVHNYQNGVISEHLPQSNIVLAPDWALQDPTDYLLGIETTVPTVIAKTGVNPSNILGIGVAFTASTMIATTADGTPLCLLDTYQDEPHAWVKLWKHHGAQPQAERIEALAHAHHAPWLAAYGGNVSSEFFLSKALQLCDEAPHIYKAADRLIEAGDWVVWQLTGQEVRSEAIAGYKAFYQSGDFPSSSFLRELNPALGQLVESKLGNSYLPLGSKAGELSPQMAQTLGLRVGTPVAVANIDAHVTAPAVQAIDPGTMVLVMGTSTCHIISSDISADIDGIFGRVRDGII
ncbi:MAG: FGGY family carbohydrate kinase, partial [Chloroflexota bacterium]